MQSNGVLVNQIKEATSMRFLKISLFDYSFLSGGGNNCGLMWLWLPGGKIVKQRRNGEFFSMVCHITWNDRFRGFVCGKPAV
uniref:C-type lectin domain-containing protein n=1 Tax=Caenorhabditis tropicalis TaxID=1561998 RepID=A0A1I7TEM9_9PELO